MKDTDYSSESKEGMSERMTGQTVHSPEMGKRAEALKMVLERSIQPEG